MTDKIEEVLEAAIFGTIFGTHTLVTVLGSRQDIKAIAKAVRKACAGAEVSEAIISGGSFVIGAAGMMSDDPATDYHQGGA